jgi:hypothetical protein
VCLRLAVIACHARFDVSVAHWRLERREQGVLRLGFKRGGPALDPRTLFLLREEAQAWDKVADGPRLLLQE